MNGAIVAITPRGRELALKLAKLIDFPVYLPRTLRRAADEAVPFTALPEILPSLFAQKRQLVLIMAAGIAVRLLAPCLQNKRSDPAVVVLDEGCRFAISLLSGHMGGANELARQIAHYLEGTAVITTATDGAGLRAVDVIARDFNLTIEPFDRVKEYNAAMLRGVTVYLFTDWPASVFGNLPGFCLLPLSRLGSAGAGQGCRAIITHWLRLPGVTEQDLMLRPKNLCVGVGCRRGVPADQIRAAIDQVFSGFNLSPASLAQLASIEQKQDEEGLIGAARQLGVPLRFFPAAAIQAVSVQYEQSNFVAEKMGVGGVCVPTAILAARSSKLLVPKQKLDRITIAVAEVESPWLGWGPETSPC